LVGPKGWPLRSLSTAWAAKSFAPAFGAQARSLPFPLRTAYAQHTPCFFRLLLLRLFASHATHSLPPGSSCCTLSLHLFAPSVLPLFRKRRGQDRGARRFYHEHFTMRSWTLGCCCLALRPPLHAACFVACLSLLLHHTHPPCPHHTFCACGPRFPRRQRLGRGVVLYPSPCILAHSCSANEPPVSNFPNTCPHYPRVFLSSPPYLHPIPPSPPFSTS
jgi:hypothetical protein